MLLSQSAISDYLFCNTKYSCLSNISKTNTSVSSGFQNTKKQRGKRKALGLRRRAFIVFKCLETPMKHEARLFEIASQSKLNIRSRKRATTVKLLIFIFLHFRYNMTFLHILTNFNPLRTLEVIVFYFYFREFTAAITWPCSKAWLRIRENDVICPKIPHGLKL